MTCKHQWRRVNVVFRVNDPGRCYECTSCGLKLETFDAPHKEIEKQLAQQPVTRNHHEICNC
jgi:hypothetical protein